MQLETSAAIPGSLVNGVLTAKVCPSQVAHVPVRPGEEKVSQLLRIHTTVLKETFLPLGLATFSLHSLTLRLCVKLPYTVRGLQCSLKPWCFPGPCPVPDAVLALEHKGNCQPVSVRLFLLLFIIHFKSNTSKAFPLRDWQLLPSQQYSKLLLTSRNRGPRVTPDICVSVWWSEPAHQNGTQSHCAIAEEGWRLAATHSQWILRTYLFQGINLPKFFLLQIHMEGGEVEK